MGMRPFEFYLFTPLNGTAWQLEMEISDVQHGGYIYEVGCQQQILWSPRPFQQQCKHGSLGPVQFRSIQDGICVLVKSHVHSTLSLRSFPNIASAVSLLPCVGDKIVDHSLGFVGLF